MPSIDELIKEIKGLTARVERLEEIAGETYDAGYISPETRLAIKRIAEATARGDNGPLHEWNRRQKLRYGLVDGRRKNGKKKK